MEPNETKTTRTLRQLLALVKNDKIGTSLHIPVESDETADMMTALNYFARTRGLIMAFDPVEQGVKVTYLGKGQEEILPGGREKSSIRLKIEALKPGECLDVRGTYTQRMRAVAIVQTIKNTTGRKFSCRSVTATMTTTITCIDGIDAPPPFRCGVKPRFDFEAMQQGEEMTIPLTDGNTSESIRRMVRRNNNMGRVFLSAYRKKPDEITVVRER